MDAESRNAVARRYVSAFQSLGSRALIANLDTRIELHGWGEYQLPITINDGARLETFVCSPRATYLDYVLEELDRFPDPTMATLLRPLVRGVGALLGPAQLDRVVHINNWMLSTNLPVPLDPTLAGAQTAVLAAAFPRHMLAIRSLTWRYSGVLMKALEAAGWILLPSRQVFLLDDVGRESFSRRDTRRDEQLCRQSTLGYEALDAVSPADAARMAELYAALYLRKYTGLNPAFTAQFIIESHAAGLLRHLVWRDAQGVIQAFGSLCAMGSHAAMPLLGYDQTRPQEEGLYRLAFHAGTRFAAKQSLHFNMSSGVGAFKRNRGAQGEIEYTAYFLGHLPMGRRLSFALLDKAANGVGLGVLRKYQL